LALTLIPSLHVLQLNSETNSQESQLLDKVVKDYKVDENQYQIYDPRLCLNNTFSIPELANNFDSRRSSNDLAITSSGLSSENDLTTNNNHTNADADFDAISYSRHGYKSGVQLSSSTKHNTLPVILNLKINPFYPLTGDNLIVTWSYMDNETETEDFNIEIQWFRYNGTLIKGTNQLKFDLVPKLTNLTSLFANNTTEDEKWFVKILISNETNSTLEYISNTITIHSVELNYVNNQYEHFLLDSEDINIAFNYSSPFLEIWKDKSFIYWYKNGAHQPNYDNRTLITSDLTQVGEIWHFVIIPYNGDDLATPIISESRTIESKPIIHEYGVEALTDIEGHYILWVNTSDPRNIIKFVNFVLMLNETDPIYLPARHNGSYWIFNFYLNEFDDNYSLLNTVSEVNVEISTLVKYSGVTSLITTSLTFTFSLKDFAPPRVNNVAITYDNLEQPTKITFTAEVEEYGSKITEILLYYDFSPVGNTNNRRLDSINISSFHLSKMAQTGDKSIDFESVKMEAINTTIYSVTLDFIPRSDTLIRFRVQITDQTGNTNFNAFPEGLNVNRAGGIWIVNTGIRPEGIITFLFILVVIIFVIFIGNYQRKQSVKKKEAIQQIQTRINNIKSIGMIFGRFIDSGLIFYREQNIPEIQADIDMFSTVSSAVSFFMQEVSSQMTLHSTVVDENKTEFEVLTRKGLHMLIRNGKYSSFTIISNRTISKNFYDILTHIGNKVEQTFTFENNHRLVQFPAPEIKKIIRKHLPMYYNAPLLLKEVVLRQKNIYLSKKELKMLVLIKREVLIGNSLNYIFCDVIIDRLSRKFKLIEIIKFIEKAVNLNLFVEASPNLIEVFPDILSQKSNIHHLVPQWSYDINKHWETMNFPNLTKPN
jgi:hypothetical protein